MSSFSHAYCRWLEELAEAQQHCEKVTMHILSLRESGRPITTEITGTYLQAHQALRSVAERFPNEQASLS